MKRCPILALIAVAMIASPAASQSRRSLIDQARNEFSDSVALELLHSAMSPALGEPDSLLAVAGYDLAAVLLRTDRRDLALVWLRWVARHASRWPLDRGFYPPTLAAANDQAVREVQSTRDAVPTSWRWPARFAAAAAGMVQIESAGQGSIVLRVEGRSDLPSGASVTLPPGTYTLVASAEGYEEARVTREVLPGAATVLALELTPRLLPETQADVAAKLVRITWMEGGQQICRNGYIAGADGLVLTSLAFVRGRSGLQVTAFDGQETFRDVRVVGTDVERNLAVLRLNTTRAQELPAATRVSSGTYAWAVHFDGCGSSASERTRLANWPSSPTSAVALAPALGPSTVGAPLVDHSGFLIGLVTSAESVTPAALTQAVVEQARRSAVAVQVQRRGGLPWIWIGAGVAAAGLTAALVGGGGGGSNGPASPTTGGITITIPN